MPIKQPSTPPPSAPENKQANKKTTKIQRNTRKLSEVTDMFITLIVVMETLYEYVH